MAAVAIAMLIWKFVSTFQTSENMSTPTFGTAGAPYSDALAPWLDGGLAFLFGLPPHNYLYRPTVGLFWSAILAATGRVEMIPIFFSFWLLVFVVGTLFWARKSSLRYALVIWLAVSAIGFSETWLTLDIATTSVDLAAFALTVSGVIVLLLESSDSKTLVLEILVGGLCLGVAAAIRGPMMLGGAIMILVRVLVVAKTPLRLGLIAGLSFAAPIAVDVGLQRYWGVVNNGLVGLFCVYFDPTHTWTPACHTEYLARSPATGEILRGYLEYVLSDAGLRHLFTGAAWRVSRDLITLQQPAVLALLLGVGLLGSQPQHSALALGKAVPPGSGNGHRRINFGIHGWPSWLLRAALLPASLLLAQVFASTKFWSGIAWLCLALAAALGLRIWRSILCLGGYIAGTMFLCLVGLYFVDRLQSTFSFTLYLGTALLIMDARAQHGTEVEAARPAAALLPCAVLVSILFLYAGNFLAPSELRSTYRQEVYGRRAAIKISDDASLDRSLYYSGDRQLIYTRHDQLAVGAVRNYRKLALEENVGNASFLKPNAFAE